MTHFLASTAAHWPQGLANEPLASGTKLAQSPEPRATEGFLRYKREKHAKLEEHTVGEDQEKGAP